MMPMKMFSKQEKKIFVQKLNEQFGIKEIADDVAKWGKEKIILFTGEISEADLKKLDRVAMIEVIGVYFAKISDTNRSEQDNGIRLSLEGVQFMKEQIEKNIFELDEKQAEEWMMGQDLNIATGRKGFLVMKFKDDFLGTGKASESKISNFIPKSRRLRYKSEKINRVKYQ